MASSLEQLIFEIIAKDKDASAAFDRFRRKVDDTSKSVDKNSTSLDRNSQSQKKNEQANRSALGTLVGVGTAFAPITAGAAAAGAGVAAFAAFSVPSIAKVTKALTGPGGLAASWNTLDNRQRNAAQGVQQLGQRYEGLAKQLEPQTFQVFNEGLSTANSLLKPAGQLARSSGQGVADFLAQFQNDSGIQHFISFLGTEARPAIDLVGSDVIHLSHAVFSLLESFGSTGISELRLLTSGFTALDDAVTFLSRVPGLSSAALTIGGIVLALSKLSLLGPALKLTGLSNIGTSLSGFTAATKGATVAEKGLLATSTALDAITPWGWVALGVTALGGLAFALSKIDDGSSRVINSLEQQNKASGFNAQGWKDAAAAIGSYQQHLPVTQRMEGGNARAIYQLSQVSRDYVNAQKQVSAGVQEQNKFLLVLQGRYAITRQQAITLAESAGVLVDKTGHLKGGFQQAETEAKAFGDSVSKATPPAGVMNDDLYVMGVNADQAASELTKVNSAWDTFLGMSTQLQTAELGIIGQMRQLAKDAHAAGASFTGVNKNSITLQQDFASLVGSEQSVIDSMRTAHATTRDLATVLATNLKKAVDDGALANRGFRTQIFDMATEAGYAGPNRIGPLSRWIDGNASSLRKANKIASTYSSTLAHIPKKESTSILVQGTGSWSVRGGNTGGAGHPVQPGPPRGAAEGWRVTGGTPGVDSVPILAQQGETVLSVSQSRRLAPALSAAGVPGYATGGVVGSYRGPLPGMEKWLASENSATITAIADTVASQASAAIKRLAATGGGGGHVGWNPSAGISQWGGDVSSALSQLGLPQLYKLDVLYQMMTESGGNPNIVNKWDSNWLAGHPSVGLMQVIAGTFDTFAGPYRNTGPFSYGVSVNPMANIYAALNYGAHNGRGFGTGPGQIGSGHGYDEGGVLPPGLSLAYNGTGRPEPLIPSRGGAGGPARVVIELRGGGGEIDRFLANWIKENVRVRGGGDVQVAFGS